MSGECDCARKLFEEVREYIKYKISEIDIQRYLSSQGDVKKLQEQVDHLLADLDHQFKHVLQSLMVTQEIDQQIENQYRLLQAKYETIPELSVDQIERALEAVTQTENLMHRIASQHTELESLQSADNLRPLEFQQECTRQLEQLERRVHDTDDAVVAIQAQVQQYTGEHQLLESQVIQLFKK